MPVKADEKTRMTALTAYAVTNDQVQAGAIAGVSTSTVFHWIADSQETLDRIRQALQAEYMGKLVDLGHMLISKVEEAKGVEVKTGKDVQAMATAFGIIVDKMMVLLGIANKIDYGLTITHQIDEGSVEQSMQSYQARMQQLRGPAKDVVDAEFRRT